MPRPKNWGGVCDSGSHQSPINIPLACVPPSAAGGSSCAPGGAIIPDYGVVKGSVINTGHALQVSGVKGGAPGALLPMAGGWHWQSY